MEKRDKSTRAFVTLLTAVLVAIGSVAYIMYRGSQGRAYKEKWQDYDECGLG